VLGGSIGFLLSKLGFISSVGFSEALASLHINPGHFAILRIVEAMEGASQQSLAEQMQIPPSRMVGLVDELEQLALLERRRNPDDRRANALYLTSKGGAVLAGATEVRQRGRRASAPDWPLESATSSSPSCARWPRGRTFPSASTRHSVSALGRVHRRVDLPDEGAVGEAVVELVRSGVDLLGGRDAPEDVEVRHLHLDADVGERVQLG
jgi:DNA-binding MarR family transcriptional regulator